MRERARCLRPIFRAGCDSATKGVWPNFRIGPKAGQPYPDTQFPVTALDELSKQGVPDVSFGGIPTPNPTLKALADLASQVNGAVLMGHSQSGSFPLAAALLNPAAMKGLVLVEPGTCPANYTDEQIAHAGEAADTGRLRRLPRHADRHCQRFRRGRPGTKGVRRCLADSGRPGGRRR